jgi:hypothetical protein
MMTKESVYHSVMAGLFLSRLTQPISEMPAYKLGLIDNKGQIIEQCKTDEEKASLTPLDRHILKIRRLIGEDVVELFKSSVLLEMVSKSDEEFDAEKYRKEIELSHKTDTIVEDIHNLFTDAVEQGFSRDHIENIFIAAIIKQHDSSEDLQR